VRRAVSGHCLRRAGWSAGALTGAGSSVPRKPPSRCVRASQALMTNFARARASSVSSVGHSLSCGRDEPLIACRPTTLATAGAVCLVADFALRPSLALASSPGTPVPEHPMSLRCQGELPSASPYGASSGQRAPTSPELADSRSARHVPGPAAGGSSRPPRGPSVGKRADNAHGSGLRYRSSLPLDQRQLRRMKVSPFSYLSS